MADNHLEQLIAEWYQHQGFFVRRNVRVGKLPKGGYAGELDVVAFHPVSRRFVHIEAGTGGESWAQLEDIYGKKFDAGRKYGHSVFSGCELPESLEAIAVLVQASDRNRKVVGGGKVMPLKTLVAEIAAGLRERSFFNASVPESLPLLRTMQITLEFCPPQHPKD